MEKKTKKKGAGPLSLDLFVWRTSWCFRSCWLSSRWRLHKSPMCSDPDWKPSKDAAACPCLPNINKSKNSCSLSKVDDDINLEEKFLSACLWTYGLDKYGLLRLLLFFSHRHLGVSPGVCCWWHWVAELRQSPSLQKSGSQRRCGAGAIWSGVRENTTFIIFIGCYRYLLYINSSIF